MSNTGGAAAGYRDGAPTGSKRVVINLREQPSNTFAWMLGRRILFSIGQRFKLRFQAISIIMYMCALGIVASINVFFYLRIRHSADILVMMLLLVTYLNFPICISIFQAMRLAELSPKHRGLLSRDQLSIECQMGSMLQADFKSLDKTKYRMLERSSSILKSCGEYLTYQEEVTRPTTVLGVKATSPAAILTALSTLIGGLGLALQSVVSNYGTGYWYDSNGVYTFTNTSLTKLSQISVNQVVGIPTK